MTDLSTAGPPIESTGALSLALALSSRPWRAALHRHCRDHEADVAVRLVTDGAALVADDGPRPDVVVVDDSTSWLTPTMVERCAARGIAVLGIHEPAPIDGSAVGGPGAGGDAGVGRRVLLRAGVADTIESNAEPERLLSLARGLRRDRDVASSFDALVARAFDPAAATATPLLVVGGPAGAGVTETAIAVAARVMAPPTAEPGTRWARLGRRSPAPAPPVLVDLDERRPRLARRLGLAVEPNVVAACDVLEGRGIQSASIDDLFGDPTPTEPGDLAETFARSLVGTAPAFPVLAGLASGDDWQQLRADEVSGLLGRLALDRPAVVARVGSELGPIAAAPRRWEVSRRTLAAADAVVAVGEATPMGLLDLVDWLRHATDLIEDRTPIALLLNRAPSDRSARARLTLEAQRLFGPRLAALEVVGHDAQVERAAWDAAVPTSGPLAAAVDRLAVAALDGLVVERRDSDEHRSDQHGSDQHGSDQHRSEQHDSDQRDVDPEDVVPFPGS
ncbi:MAG: hypothetical protein ACRBI6_13080 [Acidimicrobiales bacterium]